MKKYHKFCFCMIMTISLLLVGCSKETDLLESDNQNLEQTELEQTELEQTELEQNSDESVISYIPNAYIESGIGQALVMFGEDMLVYGTYLGEDHQGCLRIALLSMDDGDVLHEILFENMDVPNVQVCDDRIAVSDWADGEVYLLDESLKVQQKFNTETQYCGIYINSQADKVFCFTKNDGVVISDIDSMTETKVLVPDAQELLVNSACGKKVIISYIDPDSQKTVRGSVDLDLRRFKSLPFDGSFYSVSNSDDLWLAGLMDKENVYYLGREARPNMFVVSDQVATVGFMADTQRILTTVYEEDGHAVRTLYDSEGRFISKFEVTNAGISIDQGALWSNEDGGYYFVSIDSSGKDMLMFWDLSVPVSGEDLVLTADYETEAIGTVVSEHLYEKAAVLSEKYGIKIKIAEQIDEVFTDFEADAENDENYILSALEALETVFEAYPDGFIDQLLYGDYSTIEVQLAGHLSKKYVVESDVSGFTTFSGFFENVGGKSIIVVDITKPESLIQTLHHEIMHLIDHKLAFDAQLRESAIYSEEDWQKLNPSDFVYADTYTDLPMTIYTDGYEKWFVDIYSRTYASEDKARIMENAMMGNDWIFMTSPGRIDKLEYLCQCIRDCFDTDGWPEQTVWEATLKKCK